MTDPRLIAASWGLALASLVALAVWYHFLGRKRLIQDLPTSKTRGVSLGLNELHGVAELEPPVVSPSGRSCVWWKHVEYVEETSNQGGKRWKRTGERIGGPRRFVLRDDEGEVVVDLAGALVRGEETYDGPPIPLSAAHGGVPGERRLFDTYVDGRVGSSAKRRVVETVLPSGGPCYVLGTASLVTPDPSAPPQLVIGADTATADPFIVQAGTEADALYHERFAAILAGGVALAAAAGSGIAFYDGAAMAAGEITFGQLRPAGPLLALALVVVIMVALSWVFVYNGLRALHQRAQRAWSLIDVELRRRHDLVPQLVQAITAHRDHEHRVHTMVAELRAQLDAELAAEPSDEAVGAAETALDRERLALGRLIAVAEGHPELGADESFRRLQAQLVETEDRIGLARTFYNNSVEALRSRAGTFPGNLVAWVFELDLHAEFEHGTAPAQRDEVRATVPRVSGPRQQALKIGDLLALVDDDRARQ